VHLVLTMKLCFGVEGPRLLLMVGIGFSLTGLLMLLASSALSLGSSHPHFCLHV